MIEAFRRRWRASGGESGGEGGGAAWALPFALAMGVIALAYAALSIHLAGHEYFKGDDFKQLRFAQADDWSWLRTFVPIGTDRYWAIRPLGESTYFRLCWQMFGLEPRGYYLIAVAAHLATGLVAYRIARQVGLILPVAIATGLLALSFDPSTHVVYTAVGFSTKLASLLGATAVTLAIDRARGGGMGCAVASASALFAALLCHESSVALPAVLFGFALYFSSDPTFLGKGVRALKACVVPGLLVLAYLAGRFAIAPIDGSHRTYQLGFELWSVVSGYLAQTALLRDGWVARGLALGLVTGFAFALHSRESRARAVELLLPLAALWLWWGGLVLGPVVLLPIPHVRYSTLIEIPAALLIGTLIHACWQLARERRIGVLCVGLVVLVAAAMPWARLWERSQSDAYLFLREFVELLVASRPQVAPGDHLVLLWDAEGLAGRKEMKWFTLRTHGATNVVHAALHGRDATFGSHPLSSSPRPRMLCERCTYLVLRQDLTVEFAEPELVASRLLEPALASTDPRVAEAAAGRLLGLLGPPALPTLRSYCKRQGEPRAVVACLRRLPRWRDLVGAQQAPGSAQAQVPAPRASAAEDGERQEARGP